MSEFLVEAYLSRAAAEEGLPRPDDVSRAANQLTSEGRAVQLVGSVFVPDDETRFYLFHAESGDAVAEAARRCGLRFERLVPAVSDWTTAQDGNAAVATDQSEENK